MTTFPQSYEVYGFTIEVHSGGRRVWPPSFKRFITQQLDNDELTVGEVMKECNVFQALVYKWRSDIRNTTQSRTTIREERVFSEIVVEETQHPEPALTTIGPIMLHCEELDVALPAAYPVEDLVAIILSLEGRTAGQNWP